MPGARREGSEARGPQVFAVHAGVPADNIFDQYYRYQCIIDPTLPAQLKQKSQNLYESNVALKSGNPLLAVRPATMPP